MSLFVRNKKKGFKDYKLKNFTKYFCTFECKFFMCSRSMRGGVFFMSSFKIVFTNIVNIKMLEFFTACDFLGTGLVYYGS